LRLAVEFEFQDFDAAREQDQLLQLAETDNKLSMPKVDAVDYRDAVSKFDLLRLQHASQN
jgi:hypothetical protein